MVSMQMTFPKYTRNSPKPLGMYANDPQNNGTGPMASETRRRGSLTSNLGEKTASRAKEIGQYAQSQSGILKKIAQVSKWSGLPFNRVVRPLQV